MVSLAAPVWPNEFSGATRYLLVVLFKPKSRNARSSSMKFLYFKVEALMGYAEWGERHFNVVLSAKLLCAWAG